MATAFPAPRVVVVTRPTDLSSLLARHGTREQARFFLASRGQAIEELERRHAAFAAALQTVIAAIPPSWRRAKVERADLDRFVFEPKDIVVVVGQDGLTANAAKYLQGQRIIGVNPEPERYDGILVPHAPKATAKLLRAAAESSADVEARTMVAVTLDDGQRLIAVNELYFGHRTHQSARYRIAWRGAEERQSSSGIIVTTGTGATGWARSIVRQRRTEVELPAPTELCVAFFVREAFPSKATGTKLTDARVEAGEHLAITSEMNDDGVIFGDGIEDDRMAFGWGQQARVEVAQERLMLVRG